MNDIELLLPDVLTRMQPYYPKIKETTVRRVLAYHLAHPDVEPLTRAATLIMWQFKAARDAYVRDRATHAYLAKPRSS